jgi:hypothetical protein
VPTRNRPPPVDIAALLATSREAHSQYRAFLPHVESQGGLVVAVQGDRVLARAALERAALTRKSAHDADPTYADPAWQTDPFHTVHTALMTFYAEELARRG